MAGTLGERLWELRRIGQLHVNWFIVSLVGRDAIPAEDFRALEEYGRLPVAQSLEFTEQSYMLGRLKAILKNSEYKDLTFEDISSRFARFSEAEDSAVEQIKQRTLSVVRSFAQGLVDKMIDQELVDDANLNAEDDWTLITQTEMHRAKMMGSAQAIINKVDIYQNSDGIESLVSIVPAPDRCEDCAHHYIDKNGNPKVFPLSRLISMGSNADPGVKHTRKNGLHYLWKTTLPPLHPRCACRLVYIPPGMGWKDGRLQVLNKALYVGELKKAVDNSSLSATIKPPGPASTQGTTPAKPSSVPGVPAPGNVAGPGAPKQGGPQVEWEYYSGDGQPPSDGGWEKSPGGAWRRPKGSGGQGGATPEQEAQKKALKEQEAEQWNKSGKAPSIVRAHLSDGEISHTRPLNKADVGGGHVGLNAGTTLMVTIEGNGRGVMKPAREYSERVMSGNSFTEGCGTVPHGSDAQNEQDMYGFMTHMFGDGFCPVTVTREHEGKQKSVQQWAEGTHQGSKWLAENGKDLGENRVENVITTLMSKAAKPKQLEEKIGNMIFVDVVNNNNDRHTGNVQIVTDDNGAVTDILPVDNGNSFGNDLMGCKNTFAKEMASGGRKIKIPESTLQKAAKTSFGDMKRAMPGKKDWQVAQSMLRMRYMQHAMETDGHVDYSRLAPDIFSTKEHTGMPYSSFHVGKTKDMEGYYEAHDNRKLAHQQFEDFALDFIDSAASDSSHPDHAFAKEWQEKGVLMGPGSAVDPQSFRRAGKHKDYEKKVRAERATRKTVPAEAPAPEKTVVPVHDDAAGHANTIDASGGGKIQTTSERMSQPDDGTRETPIQRKRRLRKEQEKLGKSLYLADPSRTFGG